MMTILLTPEGEADDNGRRRGERAGGSGGDNLHNDSRIAGIDFVAVALLKFGDHL